MPRVERELPRGGRKELEMATLTSTQDTAILQNVAQALAVALGESWTVHTFPADDEYSRWNSRERINGPDGMSIDLNLGPYNHPGKIHADGNYPSRNGQGNMLPYGVTVPHVYCDARRPVDTIVKDIIRRLLPAYRELYAQASKRTEEHDDYTTRKNAATLRICAAFHGHRMEWRSDGSVYFDGGSAEVTPDRVSFQHLSVTMEQAERIAAVLLGVQS